ncbi:MAG: integrin [Pseudomonadota bacterium]
MNKAFSNLAGHAAVVISFAALSACGGGGGSAQSAAPAPAPITPPAAPAVTQEFFTKRLHLQWDAVPGATSYRVMRASTAFSLFSPWGDNIPAAQTTADMPLSAHLIDWMNLNYRVEACNAAGCTASKVLGPVLGSQHDSTGYFKATNTEAADFFSYRVALSGDGQTMAISAPFEDGNGVVVTDNSVDRAGAVYLFSREVANQWTFRTYLKAPAIDADDRFGWSLSLSQDGNTLAVGMPYEDSAATGINGDLDDNSATRAGAVFIYTRTTGEWTRQAYLKASNAEASDDFGYAVSLSGDGNVLAVGAPREDSSVNGIDGFQNTNLADDAGAAYLFNRSGAAWTQKAYVKSSWSGAGHNFGVALALSRDGHSLAVTAPGESSGATGVDGAQTNNNRPQSGAAYIFAEEKGVWAQSAFLKASQAIANLRIGNAVAINADGTTVAIGAPLEGSAATGIDGDDADTNAATAGAVFVFQRAKAGWSQQAYIKASNAQANDFFGFDLAFSDSGDVLAVGAPAEASGAAGIGGNQLDDSVLQAGAVYVFTRSHDEWSQRNYLKGDPSGPSDFYGGSVSLSADGGTLAVGTTDDSSAQGAGTDANIGNRPNDDSAPQAGSVYLY